MKRALFAILTILFIAPLIPAQEGETKPTPQLPEPIVVEPEQTTYAFWFNTEYLVWWIRNNPLPAPLVTAAVPPFNSFNPGAVNDPSTKVLIGQERLDTDVRQGGRFTLGAWANREGSIGFEGNYFFLGRRTQQKSVSSDGGLESAVIGLVFSDASFTPPAGMDAEVFVPFSIPGVSAGRAQIAIATVMNGFEVNSLINLNRTENRVVNLIVGYRNLNVEDNLTLLAELNGLEFFPGLLIRFEDHFETRNRFNGGQIGLGTQLRSGRWFADASGKIALGQMNQVIDVFGNSTLNVPFAPPMSGQDGFFALASNIGTHSRNVLAFVPEVTLNLGVNVTQRMSAFVGYNFIYVNNVLRAGDQIDRNLNVSQSSTISNGVLVGPARPGLPFTSSEFWAQGINLGFQVRY